jgi:coenzyme F420 biosynthesis associated uncharacterized protein
VTVAAVPAARGGRAAPDPVDWATARRIARLVAGRDALAASYLGSSLDDDFAELTRTAEHLVADFTGLAASAPVAAAVLDRRRWVDANLDGMQRLLAPLTERMGERLARSPLAPVGRQVAAGELGALVGYLAQRVLGQYDLLVPDDPERDAVYYVGPNVLALEKRFAFRPREFRLWIAVHEVTHRAQFAAVPWMRGHFFGLVHELLALVDPDPRAVLRAVNRALDELRRGRNPLDDGGLVALFAGPRQREALGQLQSLMALLEGHGDYVMTEVGARHLPGAARMQRVLHARRHAGGWTGTLHKVIGLQQKLRQYEGGERFVRSVVDAGGPRALDPVWAAPEHLPTPAELDDPAAWRRRVAGASPG